MLELSADDARRLQLRAQGLLGADGRRGGVPGVLSRLGAVQLDTISVLARSHELIPYARLGAVGRAKVEKAYWNGATAFEYWAHAACILPVADWPYFAFRRRSYVERGWRWHKVPAAVCDEVRARLKSDGPLTTRDLGGAKAGGDWWEWSDHKIAIEWLLDTGEAVCVRRDGWRRVYDLAERAIPADLLDRDPADDECLAYLVRRSGRSLGVGTRADLADYYRLKARHVDGAIEASGLVPVRVQGWRQPAWADPDALAAPVRGRHATTLLSPFDSLVWDRPRTSRVFGFDHQLEAYVPKAKRVHGYFVMPVLAGGRLIGRVDPAREGRTLVARQVSLEPRAIATATRREAATRSLAEALRRAAEWVGCDAVRVERIDPPEISRDLLDGSIDSAG
ncbi:winged helix-turn-helix domain-containing protein [Actinomadura parmotrematis]|uniref:Winged helix DNA-binding domain-containing protein n=1 Tax=Actinomadura parmotrematis TaxID=2864039 RepID=A0ABS7FY00_9ACTN|nr:crosslink repair DNA glycosylase YcaQ family protein [Actinomadura parmotrematis]MBW8484554.1 winged helix DNA-binding domain-containing protein [Actinomadura parmotrematis]